MKMISTRSRLPNRRPSHLETLEVGGQAITACIGFDEHDRPKELFLSGAKNGTDLAAILEDTSVILSVALQFGVPIMALAKSVGRVPNASAMPDTLDQLVSGSQPASLVGAALDLLTAHEPCLDGEPSSE